jgi:hypothetical protein
VVVKPPVPVHEYELPPLAVMVVLGFVQVKIADVGVTVIVGGVMFSVTTTFLKLVHPFAPVVVTRYVAGLDTLIVAEDEISIPEKYHL